MSFFGKLLRNRRAGDDRLAWNRPNLLADNTIEVRSDDFGHETTLPVAHAGKRVGGKDESPALAWSTPPAQTAQLLLVVEDPDVPFGPPFVHGLALLDTKLTELPRGALTADADTPGVRLLRSGVGRGYLGASPVKGHGPHRYAFQLFALAEPITEVHGRAPESVKPKEVLRTARALARGRIDGFYERS